MCASLCDCWRLLAVQERELCRSDTIWAEDVALIHLMAHIRLILMVVFVGKEQGQGR